ncbi:MAG TPA: MFS transporter [Terracidiphilus sp.]|nr:MFS transporter [Terracidiphilus sp.]
MHLRYLSLLRSNANFRRLWLAQLISELGDWFYSLAIYDLLLVTTHRSAAVGWAIIIETLPWFFMTPLAGYVADRFPRRTLMIAADLFRGFIVLGMLLSWVMTDVRLIYLLLGVEVIFASLFEPARGAILPNVVTEDEILPANALSSATWSVALAAGAALGGAVTALLGRNVAFVADSVSFFVSAFLILRIHVHEPHVATMRKVAQSVSAATASVREGLAYLWTNGKVLTLVLAKTGVGFLGGSLLLMVIFGERIFPIEGHGALAMGLLYAARGVGSGIGPLIGDRLTGELQDRMWRIIGVSFFVTAAAYIAFSCSPTLAVALLCLLIAHMGASNIWVMSTSLLQINTSDHVRGRVLSVDFGLFMLTIAISNYLMGLGLDTWGLTARQLAAGLGFVMIVPGVLWMVALRKWQSGAA